MSFDSPPNSAIIVFDAKCHLCSGWVQFLLRFDTRGVFRFAGVQSQAGSSLMQKHGIDPLDPATFLLLRGERAFTDSDAVLGVLDGLGWPWRVALALRVIPRALRDPVYRLIARNRYRWFGERKTCWLPSAATQARFLD
jgi:predicted DCC family thiol-disulfide oxidoreductase YuxK